MVLNVIQLHDPLNLPLKVGTIIRNDLLGHPKPAYDVVLQEPSHMLSLQYRVGGCLHPFGEIVNCH